MSKKYTAADFANAQFAEHPDGRLAVRFNIDPHFPWTFDRGDGTDEYRDVGMARNGWVPVHTKPTITESQFAELSEDLKNRTTILACALERVGIKIIPDPEPTNTERLEEILKEVWTPNESARTFAEWLDSNGVTAPNVKDN